MAGTVSMGSLYPGRPTTQEAVNSPKGSGPTATTPGNADWNVPLVPGVAGYLGIGIPTLIALGALAWYVIERYD